MKKKMPDLRLTSSRFFLSLLFVVTLLFPGNRLASAQSWGFVDVTTEAGFNYQHGFLSDLSGLKGERQVIAGGVAAGDYDGDGWIDLYVVRGDVGPNLLFRNLQNGTFEEIGASAGVALTGTAGSGPIFGDVDGDGRLDLFIGGINGSRPRLFRNLGDGTFEEITSSSGLSHLQESFSAVFGDYDRDGDLDIFISHWLSNPNPGGGYLFQNKGDGTFTDVTSAAGLSRHVTDSFLTPNFADINNDGWPDLLIASDFGTSRIFLNNQDGTFSNITRFSVITDQNGMGGTVGDYDHDGDLDWFVSSIKDPNGISEGNWGVTGNRFYRNRGNGTFEDATDETGVRDGFWGWGSCFGDFNNDGFLDLYHVNGFKLPGAPNRTHEFLSDPSRLFVSNRDGTFTERSRELGLDDRGQGRGLVCFDYDRDGDLDLFIANNRQAPRLYRNDGGNGGHFLNIKLLGLAPNTEAIGARIYVTAGGVTQMRELRAGSNFVSQNPVEVHFGLGDVQTVDKMDVVWPDGARTSFQNVQADQFLLVTDSMPSLSWPAGENNGVNPDTGISGTLFTFQATYIDADNRPPTLAEVWIDLNDDGAYAGGGIAAVTSLLAPLKQRGRGMGFFAAGAVFLWAGIRFIRMKPSRRSKLRWAELSIILFLLVGLAEGCGRDGVNGGSGSGSGSGNESESRVENNSDENPVPGQARNASKNERFAMKEVDPADQDFTDGKDYLFSTLLETAGDGVINYLFKFSIGTRSVPGDPATEQTLTIQ